MSTWRFGGDSGVLRAAINRPDAGFPCEIINLTVSGPLAEINRAVLMQVNFVQSMQCNPAGALLLPSSCPGLSNGWGHLSFRCIGWESTFFTRSLIIPVRCEIIVNIAEVLLGNLLLIIHSGVLSCEIWGMLLINLPYEHFLASTKGKFTVEYIIFWKHWEHPFTRRT